MCYKVECEKCHKWTWAGCGAHIEQALRGVPPEQRCKCREAPSAADAHAAAHAALAAMPHGVAAGGKELVEAKSLEDLKEQLKTHKNVVVDFYGDWCTVCKEFKPFLEKNAAATPDVYFMKCECAEQIKEAQDEYNIGPLPTIMFFHNGAAVPKLTVEGKKEQAFTQSLKALQKM